MSPEEGKRLKDVRKALGLSQYKFVEFLGRTQGSYPDIESGKKGISFKIMRKLITVFRINPNYIYLGQLPMFLDDNQPEPIQSRIEEYIVKVKVENDTLKQANEKLRTRLAKQREQRRKLEDKIAVLRQRLGDE